MDDANNCVYVVHDDSDVLLDLYEVLSAAGFRVAASSNALDALSYLAGSRPQAILRRWEMPGMDGPEFIRRVQQLIPGARIILSSLHADGSMYEEVLRWGGHDLIREPFNQSTVVHAVSRMLGWSVPYEISDEPGLRRLDTPVDQGRAGECR